MSLQIVTVNEIEDRNRRYDNSDRHKLIL